ncbi:chitin-binding type-2 domain-containing protein [Caerostris extrusa]|uniref:Chitin-binding type-2 domain-containing protein n=1 Tax=Caerostris extrusa TaxID=172846 RepID=A0AAV4Y494_CAEEX|nr:chitin-binding type-2 domain-containing protein [Caerostris extrusa]
MTLMRMHFWIIVCTFFLQHTIHAKEIRGVPEEDYPTYYVIPKTSFRCSEQLYNPGFYADTETRCQVFHYCYEHRQESFLCPMGNYDDYDESDIEISPLGQSADLFYKMANLYDVGTEAHPFTSIDAESSKAVQRKSSDDASVGKTSDQSLVESKTKYHVYNTASKSPIVDKEHPEIVKYKISNSNVLNVYESSENEPSNPWEDEDLILSEDGKLHPSNKKNEQVFSNFNSDKKEFYSFENIPNSENFFLDPDENISFRPLNDSENNDQILEDIPNFQLHKRHSVINNTGSTKKRPSRRKPIIIVPDPLPEIVEIPVVKLQPSRRRPIAVRVDSTTRSESTTTLTALKDTEGTTLSENMSKASSQEDLDIKLSGTVEVKLNEKIVTGDAHQSTSLNENELVNPPNNDPSTENYEDIFNNEEITDNIYLNPSVQTELSSYEFGSGNGEFENVPVFDKKEFTSIKDSTIDGELESTGSTIDYLTTMHSLGNSDLDSFGKIPNESIKMHMAFDTKEGPGFPPTFSNDRENDGNAYVFTYIGKNDQMPSHAFDPVSEISDTTTNSKWEGFPIEGSGQGAVVIDSLERSGSSSDSFRDIEDESAFTTDTVLSIESDNEPEISDPNFYFLNENETLLGSEILPTSKYMHNMYNPIASEGSGSIAQKSGQFVDMGTEIIVPQHEVLVDSEDYIENEKVALYAEGTDKLIFAEQSEFKDFYFPPAELQEPQSTLEVQEEDEPYYVFADSEYQPNLEQELDDAYGIYPENFNYGVTDNVKSDYEFINLDSDESDEILTSNSANNGFETKPIKFGMEEEVSSEDQNLKNVGDKFEMPHKISEMDSLLLKNFQVKPLSRIPRRKLALNSQINDGVHKELKYEDIAFLEMMAKEKNPTIANLHEDPVDTVGESEMPHTTNVEKEVIKDASNSNKMEDIRNEMLHTTNVEKAAIKDTSNWDKMEDIQKEMLHTINVEKAVIKDTSISDKMENIQNIPTGISLDNVEHLVNKEISEIDSKTSDSVASKGEKSLEEQDTNQHEAVILSDVAPEVAQTSSKLSLNEKFEIDEGADPFVLMNLIPKQMKDLPQEIDIKPKLTDFPKTIQKVIPVPPIVKPKLKPIGIEQLPSKNPRAINSPNYKNPRSINSPNYKNPSGILNLGALENIEFMGMPLSLLKLKHSVYKPYFYHPKLKSAEFLPRTGDIFQSSKFSKLASFGKRLLASKRAKFNIVKKYIDSYRNNF